MQGFVYIWINKINNKRYIGSHIGHINDGYVGSGTAFNRAIKKYGIENFERVILEQVQDRNDVRKREQYYLDLFDAANDKMFYNMRAKVDGGFEYVNSLPHVKELNRAKLKTRWKELPHPKGFMNKKHTDESKLKTSQSVRQKFRELGISNPVIQMDLDGNFIMRHASIRDAAKSVNGSPSNIKYTIEGKFKKAYNYTWKYEVP